MDITIPSTVPKFTRPELLTQYDIPRGLQGVNPRTILGRAWWDGVRRETYAMNDYRCFACGCDPFRSPHSHIIEAHECYDYNLIEHTATYRETVALCQQCHRFIHCIRLVSSWLLRDITDEIFGSTLEHGKLVIANAGLAMNPVQEAIVGTPRDAQRFKYTNQVALQIHAVCHELLSRTPPWSMVIFDEVFIPHEGGSDREKVHRAIERWDVQHSGICLGG